MTTTVMNKLRRIAKDVVVEPAAFKAPEKKPDKPKKKLTKAQREFKKEYARRRNEMDALAGDIQAKAILSVSNRLFIGGKTIKSLTLATGLCSKTLTNMRNRTSRRPAMMTWLKMMEATGVDLDYLLKLKK